MSTDTILKLLEAPESDNDELNARIWCWENGEGKVVKNTKTLNYITGPAIFENTTSEKTEWKEMLKMMTTKKALLSMLVIGAPIVGIAVSPTFAASFAEHLSGMLQLILDALPTDAASVADSVPAE